MKTAGSISSDLAPGDNALKLLRQSHDDLRHVVDGLQDEELRTQYHPDLSPLGWHLGHCGFIGRFWIEHHVLGDPAWSNRHADYYLPERNQKSTRSDWLPKKESLFRFVDECFNYSTETLAELLQAPDKHPLLNEAYLVCFLVQHNYQHRETMLQVLQQRLIGREAEPVTVSLAMSRPPRLPSLDFEGTQTMLGARPNVLAYDNELTRHAVTLEPFSMAVSAVSNAEFLHFIESSGYRRRDLWSDAGWEWLQRVQVSAPVHWRTDSDGAWYALEPEGAVALIEEADVSGINQYEAEAFARYAGCRLPREAEWEHATTSGNLIFGGAWEWCANSFYPYPGFKAFPYDNYSLSWFDGNHFSLRGGSRHTHPLIKRPTFRNFYTADKRHIFAGLRLARDL